MQRTRPHLGVRLRRVDPLVPGVFVVSAVIFALHGIHGFMRRDLALYTYAGQQVVEGLAPYIGVLNRSGPLAHLIPGLGVAGARLGGIDDVLGVRLLFLLISAGCAAALYLLGRDLFGSRLAGLSAAVAIVSFTGFIEYASNGPREKTALVLFLVLSFWAMTNRRWLTAGVFLGLATLVLQIAFFIGFPALLLAAVLQPRGERIRALVRVALGGLVTLVICLAYFAIVGALQEFFDAYILINARYTSSSPLNLGKDVHTLVGGYGVSLGIITLGLVGLVALSIAALWKKPRAAHPWLVKLAPCGVAAVGGFGWIMTDFDSWPDLFPLLPMAALGMGALAAFLVDRLPAKVAGSVVLAWVLAASVLATYTAISTKNDGLYRQRQAMDKMLDQLPDDATIVSMQAPAPLVLSQKTNLTRYQMLSDGMDDYIDDTWPGGIAGFIDHIKEAQPTLVAADNRRDGKWAPRFKPEFVKVGEGPGWVWLVNRSVGPEVIEQLQRNTPNEFTLKDVGAEAAGATAPAQ